MHSKIEWFPRNTLWFGTKTNRSNCIFNIPVTFSFLWYLETGDPGGTNWSRKYLRAKSSCLLERVNMHNYHPNIVFTVEKNQDHFFDTAFAYKNKFKKPGELRRPTKKLNAFLVNYKYSNKPPPLGRQGCCIKYQAAFVSHFSYFGQINWLRT